MRNTFDRRWMPTARCTLAAVVLALLPACGEATSTEALRTVERRPFSILMPNWPAEANDDAGLGGRLRSPARMLRTRSLSSCESVTMRN
jgi:hypothetical protein